MVRSTLALLVALALAIPAAAGSPRTIDGAVSADAITTTRLDAGVGDIIVTAVEGAAEITVSVRLEPRRGGFFSSMKKAQREVDEAELRMDVSKGVLRLEIETDSNDRHFEENWTIQMPARTDFNLDLGVGDVEVSGLRGTLNADIGVGDLVAENIRGDVNLDIGVGEARVVGAAADYGSVAGSGGVGDAKLMVRGEKVSSSGFVGHSAEWTGDGEHFIEIEIGVGDARVTLD
ncbi:MAG: hypothetical protein V2I67_20220 [Thermoanaerobaculales bacterium]|jgi:hypothetical protein|nr:hypothetical protein [Thermoanaerobaculales bacterium]